MSSPAVLVVTCNLDELRELVRGEVDAALAAHVRATSTHTRRVTLDDLARLEACSRTTVRRLVAEGAPVTYVGQSPRFDVEAFRAWLDARGRQGTKAAPPRRELVPGVRLLSRGSK